jgi:hypothetical protein
MAANVSRGVLLIIKAEYQDMADSRDETILAFKRRLAEQASAPSRLNIRVAKTADFGEPPR